MYKKNKHIKRTPLTVVSAVIVFALMAIGITNNAKDTANTPNTASYETTDYNYNYDDYSSKNNSSNTDNSQSSLNVTVLDVGQGLSVLVNCDNHYMLYDGGNGDYSSFLVSYLSKNNITNFDYVIASHYDADHISGLVGVIYNYSISQLIAPNYTASSRIYNSFIKAINTKGISITYPTAGATYPLGNAKLQILAPNSPAYESENDYSIVVKITFGNSSVLITGDATQYSENEMINNQIGLNSDILVVGHHGSSSSTSSQFLNAVNPQYAVISCGKNNSYGHPTSEVLERLASKNVTVLRTDLAGTIDFTIKNNSISYNTEKNTNNNNSNSNGNSNTNNNSSSNSNANTNINNSSNDNNNSNTNIKNNNGGNDNTNNINSNINNNMNNDATTPAITYVLNTNTMKFHLPSCKHASEIADHNKLLSNETRDAILEKGYVPCKTCNP